MKAFLGVCAFLIAVLGPTLPAAAFRLTPIEMTFEPAGRGATQIFQIENDAATPIAVEIRVTARGQDGEGEDIDGPAGDDWIIFPEQLILTPGQTQSLRVQWAGTAQPDQELSYRLVAEQLPIDLEQTRVQGGQVRLLVQYKASLYVRPAGAAAKIAVVSAKPFALSDGTVLELVLRNEGTAHQILAGPTLTLSAGGRSTKVAADRLGGLAGENILPGVTRRFLLPWPADLPMGPLDAKLDIAAP